MNDRIYRALQVAGVKEAPLTSLEQGQQLFALTAQTLLYQLSDQSAAQRVTLQDVTRIHSDQAGTLRVETATGTAITASLLGYDPGRVQRFFQQVRDSTARAKQQPTSPLPHASADSGAKSFAPADERPEPLVLGAAPTPSPTQTPTVQFPAQAASKPLSKVVKIGPPQTDPTPPLAAPGNTRPAAPSATSASTSALPAAPSTSAAAPHTLGSAPGPASLAASSSAALSLKPTLTQTQLLKASRSVSGLSVTLRVLSVVLVLGALGMAYVMWRQGKSSQIPALWTVTLAIVTAVGLNVLAEVVRFLGDLGKAVASSVESRSE